MLVAAQNAQVDSLFEKACSLNVQGDYVLAAEMFSLIQDETSHTNDIETYILAITAQGECYYMLGATAEMRELIEEARVAYSKSVANISRLVDLKLREAIYKLEGSYFSVLSDYDADAYAHAYSAYESCLLLLDSIQAESYMDDSELKMTIYRELLNLYYKQKRYNEALKIADEILTYRQGVSFEEQKVGMGKTNDYIKFVDAYVSYAMVLARLREFDDAMLVLNELPHPCNSEPSVIRAKGKVLMLQYAYEGIDNRKQAQQYYVSYLNHLKREISHQLNQLDETKQEQYWLMMHSFLYDCYCLEDFSTEMLYDLALYSKGYLLVCHRRGRQAQNNWRRVCANLRSDECAIEFVQYLDHQEERQIAALVLKKGFKSPRFVKIGSVKVLEAYRLSNGETLGEASVCDNGSSKDVMYSDTTLFTCIWPPELLQLTAGSSVIYFSPDGFFHQLAIEYMYPDTNVKCYRLSSTRRLTTRKTSRIDSLLLIGGVDYTANVASVQMGNDVWGYESLRQNPLYVNYLYGTSQEVDSIFQELNTSSGYHCNLLKADKATESALLSLPQQGYSALHIATHGYFRGNLNFTDLKPLYVDRCLSECGIIMAGAGRNLNDIHFNPRFRDGVVTAKELAEIDFSNFELVVLSACQSGLGQITQDGVYGVQRSLKKAGAGAIIVSLWSVDDRATVEFMNCFYKALTRNGNIYESFNEARSVMLHPVHDTTSHGLSRTLSRRKNRQSFDSPQFTNAFILIDAL